MSRGYKFHVTWGGGRVFKEKKSHTSLPITTQVPPIISRAPPTHQSDSMQYLHPSSNQTQPPFLPYQAPQYQSHLVPPPPHLTAASSNTDPFQPSLCSFLCSGFFSFRFFQDFFSFCGVFFLFFINFFKLLTNIESFFRQFFQTIYNTTLAISLQFFNHHHVHTTTTNTTA